jgi:hypothetical protein
MVYTWGKKIVEVGSAKEFCDRCQRERSHQVILLYGYFGVFYVFNLVNSKEYFIRCSTCRAESAADPAEVQREFPHHAIPAMDRYGCLVFIGTFILIVSMFTCLQSR